jgi:predicted metal-dependent phosphoesterase TrpH
MPFLRGNLHTHTTLSDGRLSPREVLRAYREKAYDFLAFTDHRCLIGEGVVAARDYFRDLPSSEDGFVVLFGIEEEPIEIRKRHVGVIRGANETLRILNHPSEYGLSVDEVIESIALAKVDALEVTCHGRHLARYDVPEIPVPKIATDDSHFIQEIGVSWIEVEATRDADAILRAVKHGDFERFVQGRRMSS